MNSSLTECPVHKHDTREARFDVAFLRILVICFAGMLREIVHDTKGDGVK